MDRQTTTRWIIAALRAMTYLAGTLFGLVFAATALMGASAAFQFIFVFGGLGLALAAPLCWFAVARTRAGDRCTLGYLAGWGVLIAAAYLAEAIEGDKPVQAGDAVGRIAIALVAALYVILLPLAIGCYRHRRQRSHRGY